MIKSHKSVQMVDILNTFCEQLLQTVCIFHVLLVQVASIHRVSFLCVDA